MKCKLDCVKLRTYPAASDSVELQAGMLWALEPKVHVLFFAFLTHFSIYACCLCARAMLMCIHVEQRHVGDPGDSRAGRCATTADLDVEPIELLLLLCPEVI